MEVLFNWKIGTNDDGSDKYGIDLVQEKYKPTGTFTFVPSIVKTDKETKESTKCELNLDTGVLICTGKKIEPKEYTKDGVDYYRYDITDMIIDDGANRIRVEYSGDFVFKPSSSSTEQFLNIPTTFGIIDPKKSSDNKISMTVEITPDAQAPKESKINGTVKFTSGSKFEGCSGDAKYTSGETDKKATIVITNMVMSADPGTDIKGEYSGNSLFTGSSSETVPLGTKIKTDLKIEESKKKKDDQTQIEKVSMTLVLTPDADETGTISFTSGTATCKIDITDHTDIKFTEPCKGTAQYSGGKIVITDMEMSGTPGTSIKAEYSGDTKYDNSSAEGSLLQPIKLELSNVYKPANGLASLNALLTWTKEDAGDSIPTGTLTFNFKNGDALVSACKLDMKAKTIDCTGEKTTITRDPDKDEDVSGSLKWILDKVLLASNDADRVQAEYSGDNVFDKASSIIVMFKMIPTRLQLSDQSKTGSGLVNVTAVLDWDEWQDVLPEGMVPTGTIKFTSGSAACTLSLETKDFLEPECRDKDPQTVTPDSAGKKVTVNIKNMKIGDGSGKTLKAEYSGDVSFEKSTSNQIDFDKINTELDITRAYKPGSGLANIDIVLKRVPVSTETFSPTETITFTIGSGTCTLNIVTESFSCAGKDTSGLTPDKSTTGEYKWSIKNIVLPSDTADRVKAEYSGDAIYNPSSSKIIMFETIPTSLALSNQNKTAEGLVSVTTVLSWTADHPDGTKPGGTIKYTSGTGVCTLSFSTKDFIEPDCRDTVPPNIVQDDVNKTVTVTVKNMEIGDGTGSTLKAEYSGDGLFLASVSDTVDFNKVNTTLDITNAYKPGSGLANIDIVLKQDPAVTEAFNPTGTITFTIGSGTCKLDIRTQDFDCEGEDTEGLAPDKSTSGEYKWSIKNIVLSSDTADRVKAEYNGDAVYNPSVSKIVMFKTIPTTLRLYGQSKNADGLVSVTTELSWTDAHPAGTKPHGTIKFTSESAVCTLDLDTAAFIEADCGGTVTPPSEGPDAKKRTYIIKDMRIGDGSGKTLAAEYSGDGLFLKSTSNTVDFNKVNTELLIQDAYKPAPGLANIDFDLKWNPGELVGSASPTGTITFTIGSEVCRLNFTESSENFTCSGTTTTGLKPDRTTAGLLRWSIKNVVLSSDAADRVSMVYEGNAIYNPSSSVIFMFKTVPTRVDINDQRKTADGLVNMNTVLEWDDNTPADMVPHGTIKFTSGGASCTLSLDTEKFIDCEGSATPVSPQEAKKLEYTIENLKIGDGTGQDIKAEYSGDGFYLASASEAKDFTKVNTELDILQAYKTGSNLANVTSLLTWKSDKVAPGTKPTGTITFTVGGNTCTLDITTQVFSCTGELTKITSEDVHDEDEGIDGIKWTIEKMLLASESADRVQAVYSGDAVFNGSSSKIVLFKTIETTLTLSGYKKTASGLVGTTVNLGWAVETEEPYATMKPHGTIKLISSTASCTMEFKNTSTGWDARWIDCQGSQIRVSTPGTNSLSFEVSSLDMGGNTGDSLRAEYSGTVVFLPSASDSQFFNKADTHLNITSAYKGDDGLVNLKTALDWLESEAGESEPSGAITFTIGSETCRMDIVTKNFSCSGESTVVSDPVKKTVAGKITWEWTITNILLTSTGADRVKADYNGDSIFNPSSSRIVLFQNVETQLGIEDPRKASDGKLSMDLNLSWTDDPPAPDMTPGGTIKITSGTAVCTLSVANDAPAFTDCQGKVQIDKTNPKARIYKITELNMGDKAGDDLKAEYSGDGTFLASASNTVYFDRTDTTLEINPATKAGDYLVNVTTILSWDVPTDPAGLVPEEGTITFTFSGETCKLVYDLDEMSDPDYQSVVDFNCAGEDTTVKVTNDSEHGHITWALTNILLNSNTADRVKAEYGGDANFNPSASKIVIFPTVATTTTISDQDKEGILGPVKLKVSLGWAATAPAGKTPTGSIKLTSGSAVCTMKIEGETASFEAPCTGSVQASSSAGNPRTFDISGLMMGPGIGDDIKAEYSGDGVFMASVSDTLYFNKVNATLEIDRAWKFDTSALANIDGKLTWDPDDAGSATPAGTIKFTIGSETCTMNIDSPQSISCAGLGTDVRATVTEPGQMTLKLRKVLLSGTGADRVKAEYSGDAVFNPSTSTTKMFETKETITRISSPIKKSNNMVDLTARISWDGDLPEDVELAPGTMTFTSGSKSCTLNLRTKRFSNCAAEPDAAHPVPVIINTVTGEITVYNLEMGAEAGTTIKAEYSGNSYFEKSVSPTVEFTKVDTTLAIDAAVKKADADVTTSLKWNKNDAMSNKPTGTNKLIIGSDTCVLTFTEDDLTNIDNFTCAGENTDITLKHIAENVSGKTFEEDENGIIKDDDGHVIVDSDGNVTEYGNGIIGYRWTISNIVLTSTTADRITADYSGDSIFNASESKIVKFKTVDTKTDIVPNSAVKVGDGSMANVDMTLIWKKDDAVGNEPSGTMTMNIGSDTCRLTIDRTYIPTDTDPGRKVDLDTFTCAGESTVIKMTRYPETDGYIGYKWSFSNIVLTSNTADRITASYGGDFIFNKSESLIVKFETIDTKTDIDPDSAVKVGDGSMANADITLKWKKNDTISSEPTGTMTMNIGSDTCKLTIDKNYLPTTEDPGRKVDPDSFTCSGVSTEITMAELPVDADGNIGYKWSFRNIVLTSNTADRLTASYDGDVIFNKSESLIVKFKTVPTETIITKADLAPDGAVDEMIVLVKWDKTLTTDTEKPTGTIKLTAGSSTCTMQMGSQPKFTDCDFNSITPGDVEIDGVPYPVYTITGLKIGDGTAPSIKAEYSGDGLFVKSEADEFFFKHVDTTLTIVEHDPETHRPLAYKPSNSRVNLSYTLNWFLPYEPEPLGDVVKPVGTVTFTMGSDICKLDLANKSFTCADAETEVYLGGTGSEEVDDKYRIEWYLTLNNILLSSGNDPDRVKAEFSGDKLFNPSFSDYVLFTTLPTTLSLRDQVKMPAGTVNVDLTLERDSFKIMGNEPKPNGTIKLTSGSAVCTLDISASPAKFTDCSGSVSVVDKTYKITGLDFGGNAGGDIVAEYSGDGLFLSSKSEKKYFSKIDTELAINSVYKPNDPALVSFVSVLSWDREKAATRRPVGTIRFTSGSGSCTLNLSTKKMVDCDTKNVIIAPKTIGDNITYEILVDEMAVTDTTADGITAEYSGDAVFNASSTAKVLFKTVDTTIDIVSSYKPDEKHATITAKLEWDETIADGRKPAGSVKFVVGSGSCTLTIRTGELDCEPGTGTISADRRIFKVKDMLIDDSSADRVSVEYSGDGFFNPSKTNKVLFDRIDTEITIKTANRYKDSQNVGGVRLDTLLGWDENEDEGKTPTGTLKITIGEKYAEYDLTAKTLKINDQPVDTDKYVMADFDLWSFLFKDLPLNAENATTAKIEYSGDIYFGPSSKTIEFEKIKTSVIIDSIGYEQNNGSGSPIIFTLSGIVKRLSPNFDNIPFTGHIDNIDIKLRLDNIWVSHATCKYLNGGYDCGLNYEGFYYKNYTFDPLTGSFTFDFESRTRTNPDEFKGESVFTIDYSDDMLYAETDDTTRGKFYTDFASVQTVTQIKDITALQLDDEERTKYLQFTLFNGTSGQITVTTSNGKSCTFRINDESICGAEEIIKNEVYGSVTVTLKGMTELDLEKAEKIYIQYQGDRYHKSAINEKEFDEFPTTLGISQIENKGSDKVDMNLSLGYTPKELINKYWPAGSLVISKGSYTCTVPLDYGVNEAAYTKNLTNSCGGGTARVYSQGGENRLVIEIKDLPVTDHQTTKYTARYSGDWSNAPSKAEKEHGNQVDVNFSVTYEEKGTSIRSIHLTLRTPDTSQTAIPQGSAELKFMNNGNTCVWDLSDVHCECDVSDFKLMGFSSGPGYRTIEMRFDTDRQLSGYDMLELSYSGDDNYRSTTAIFPMPPFKVTLTPVTDYLYDDGRLYFNTENYHPQFPKFPEAYTMADCASMPEQCRTLKDEFSLTVSVFVENNDLVGTDSLPSTDWPFNADVVFTGDIDHQVSCTPENPRDVENGRVYACTTENVRFKTPAGEKNIHAHLDGTWLTKEANEDFPTMFAVTVNGSALDTTTLFKQPAPGSMSVGQIVTVEADTTYNGTSIWGSSTPSYLYYTYSGVEGGNKRIETCTGSSCTLTITDNTKSIVAEFLGNETYAPSRGVMSVNLPTVTLDVTLGGDGG